MTTPTSNYFEIRDNGVGPQQVVLMDNAIVLKGVKTHNLKNVSLTIPHGTLAVVTGVSGSGKSSLAFDTLYAEGRRRYVESLSSYSRQFLERIERPDLDFVSGILPAIAIEAKNVVTNARSTVGTQTELNDYLRLLFARIGITYCASCGKVVESDSPASIFAKLKNEMTNQEVLIAFPLELEKKDKSFALKIFEELERQGFLQFISSGKELSLAELSKQYQKLKPPVLVIIDQFEFKTEKRGRFFDSLESALKYGKGHVSVLIRKTAGLSERKFSNQFHCADCDKNYRAPHPNTFSFNSPLGACASCQGFGRIITIDWNLVIPNPRLSIAEGVIEPWTKPSAKWEFKQLKDFCKKKKISLDKPFNELKEEHREIILEGSGKSDFFSVRDYFKYLEKKTYKMHVRIFLSKYRGFVLCPECHGTRLKPESLQVKIAGKNISELSAYTIASLKDFFEHLKLFEHDQAVADSILLEIKNRLSFLDEVGLGYLTLDRLSRTLSGGEAQRIHLASSLGSALVDTLYVLDEPSVGLHERDNGLLIRLLGKLKALGNTVVVVEHDRTMIEAADQVIDMGPLGGERGGQVVFSGPFQKLTGESKSETARYFRNELKIERTNGHHKTASLQSVRILGAREHNLKNINIEIPLHQLVVITGVSGSGKSTLIYDVLCANYQRLRGRPVQDVGAVTKIDGWQNISDIRLIDQSPIGRTPRSNPVTYIKAFEPIRKIFAQTREAKMHGLDAGHFSFNVPGGRCEKCEGDGTIKIEMHFLADVYVTCEECGGSRYQSRVLDVRYRGKNIKEVLEMTVEEAIEFFSAEGRKDTSRISESLSVLSEIGLGYLKLGQSATTLSGGEAQRLKLAAELSRSTEENLLYLFDEPTTGLHYYDIAALLLAFEKLISRGHSLCIIEHNMEVIKCADYVIDLGPEGGQAGGNLVYAGPLAGLLKQTNSYTGMTLKKYLKRL